MLNIGTAAAQRGVSLTALYMVLRERVQGFPINSILRPSDSGQAMVEFVLSAITIFFVLLGILQFALILNAQTMVRYAAYNAARTASVTGGNPEKMQEAARLSLLATFPSHGRADNIKGFTQNYLAAKATDSDPSLTATDEPITEVKLLNQRALPCGQTVTFDDPAATEDAVITVQVIHRYELVIPLVVVVVVVVVVGQAEVTRSDCIRIV